MTTTTTQGPAERRSWRDLLASSWRQNIIYLGFVVIFVLFAVTLYDQGFLDPDNLLNIIRQTAMISVTAPLVLSRIASSTAISSKGFILIFTLARSTPLPSAFTRGFTL